MVDIKGQVRKGLPGITEVNGRGNLPWNCDLEIGLSLPAVTVVDERLNGGDTTYVSYKDRHYRG